MTSLSASRADRAGHLRGIALGVVGGLCISFGGPAVRLIESADGWQFLAWRSIAFAALMLTVAVWRTGGPAGIMREIRAMGWLAPAIAVVLGGGMAAYVFALLTTTVANVVFVIGSGPLFAAFVAWLALGERLSARGFAALLAAAVGVAVMFGDGLTGATLLGHFMSLLAMVTYAGYVILLRVARGADTFIASGLAGLFAAALATLMAGGNLAVPTTDLGLALFSGLVQVGLGFLCVTLAARHLPAAELTLLILIETVLGPIWVWLIVDEVPSAFTLIGGVVVLASVAAYAVFALDDGRRRAAAVPK